MQLSPHGLFFVLSLPVFPSDICDMITTREMLKQMETGEVFSLTVSTYDRKRKKGGEVVHYPEARLVQSLEKEIKVGRALTRNEAFAAVASGQAEQKRDPNHRLWYSRNLRIVQEGHDTSIIRKFHPPLVSEFNGHTVVP